jgi:hypothetical protein
MPNVSVVSAQTLSFVQALLDDPNPLSGPPLLSESEIFGEQPPPPIQSDDESDDAPNP